MWNLDLETATRRAAAYENQGGADAVTATAGPPDAVRRPGMLAGSVVSIGAAAALGGLVAGWRGAAVGGGAMLLLDIIGRGVLRAEST